MNRPEFRVFFKRADGSGYVGLCAFWRNDRGLLSGRLDRNVRAIKIVRDDGTEEVLRVSEKGYVEGMFLNARSESDRPQRRPQRAEPPPDDFGPQRAEPPPDDFGDDDLPF